MPNTENLPNEEYLEKQRKHFKNMQMSERNLQHADKNLREALSTNNPSLINDAQECLRQSHQDWQAAVDGISPQASPTQQSNFSDASMLLNQAVQSMSQIHNNLNQAEIDQVINQLDEVKHAFAEANTQQINPTII
ncbi:hypothetical protein SAMN00017405_2080 [Desulfonispora thiosulfatigenes DSM 11270]|uniref:Uncharacterized protein n=1 Tax=Desulfonispora thiosulfatigenes DSM 11270 TaxID=656914 RepID=A0A1W1VHH5_DESTI|nr:hypothetical protein [Desulfonispora thiosulfatigenes]SMB92670.1 hypothetical protein SAMN00017405_2080 [Desulfonispora thiosulfatigenes DSM 11270]